MQNAGGRGGNGSWNVGGRGGWNSGGRGGWNSRGGARDDAHERERHRRRDSRERGRDRERDRARREQEEQERKRRREQEEEERERKRQQREQENQERQRRKQEQEAKAREEEKAKRQQARIEELQQSKRTKSELQQAIRDKGGKFTTKHSRLELIRILVELEQTQTAAAASRPEAERKKDDAPAKNSAPGDAIDAKKDPDACPWFMQKGRPNDPTPIRCALCKHYGKPCDVGDTRSDASHHLGYKNHLKAVSCWDWETPEEKARLREQLAGPLAW
eukprot:g6711.t1